MFIGTAKIWFQTLDSPTSSNIEKIFSAFLVRFKPLGPDLSKEATFFSLRQMPQETPNNLPTECLKRAQN